VSKLIRISDYAYDYLKSLDGKITDNFDEIIKKHSSELSRAINMRRIRNNFFNRSRLLSIAILSEAIKQKEKFITRQDFITNTSKDLQGWERFFPTFFKSLDMKHSWKGGYQRTLDSQLNLFSNPYGLLNKDEPRNVLCVWSLDRRYLEKDIRKIFRKEFPDSKEEIHVGRRVLDMEIFKNEKSHLLEFKNTGSVRKFNGKLINQYKFYTLSSYLINSKKEAKEVVSLSKQFAFLDEDKNIIEYNSGEDKITFQITDYRPVSFPNYKLSDDLQIFMDNSFEFLNEILNVSNNVIMPGRDYFPNIRDYVYKKNNSKKSILLMNTMKLDFLEKKMASRKISREQRENIQIEIKKTEDSENYKKEIFISKKPSWKPIIDELRSVQSLGKSLREQG